MTYNKEEINLFIKRWMDFFTSTDPDIESLTTLQEACLYFGFKEQEGIVFLEYFEFDTFNHNKMYFLLEKVESLDVVGSLLLLAVHLKLDWFSQEEHYDLYFSNYWFVLVLRRLESLLLDEIKQDLVKKIHLRLNEEYCMIDGKKGFIEFGYQEKEERFLSRLENKAMVDRLLFELDSRIFFKANTFNTHLIHIREESEPKYNFTIEYQSGYKVSLNGYFDYYNLPLDYRLFVVLLHEFFAVRPYFKLFDDTYFLRLRGREDEKMYCMVVFDSSDKVYTYASFDASIVKGDFVLVPAGKNNEIKEVEVVDVRYLSEDKIPDEIKPLKVILNKL